MTAEKLGPNRRMGPVGSENWHAMLDGAEHILREEGHAKLTSRRIAEQIGVKQRLVYYYFHTMDDLIVAMFRRSSERDLRQQREVSAAPMPLRRLWELAAYSHDARLISEYMALANRIPDLKAEVIKFIDESRAIQVAAITRALEASGTAAKLPATALAIIATSVGLSLNREEELGLSSGHADMQAVLAGFLDLLEPQG
ncbi:TetR/AcrR family transcriptional regulator [Novosphingobium sp. JCM 18896]|uniref:TetR/AcrR family transcriptional regulator n=1 Tax=Novosphingobium sp. JCM 18896 TaxID=2989731 RepID=UPI002223BD1C|nr:TetR/AcrR family transcriptional regulator [Novosphingobium sp. JCM 18896]MCW1427786.1 TetR/AcrR family transcriptional regulator [Novosphingobium sp. JCM 18896]